MTCQAPTIAGKQEMQIYERQSPALTVWPSSMQVRVTIRSLSIKWQNDECHSLHRLWAEATLRSFVKGQMANLDGTNNFFSIFYFEKFQTPKR